MAHSTGEHWAERGLRDAGARADLERIVHPYVESRIRDVLTEYAGSDQVVVVDVALLANEAVGRGTDSTGRDRRRRDEQTCIGAPDA